MGKKLRALYAQHGDVLRYLIIGGLTTLLDIAVFALLHTVLGLHYQVAKVISWIAAVIFAFWGNKFVVFRTRTESRQQLLKEAASFTSMRLLTLLFSVAFLFVAVELLHMDENLSNIISNVFVVIFNYVLSKLVVFRKKKDADER